MERELLAAQLYAFHYAKPSDRISWGYHLTPKQSFKAADHFLKYAATQRPAPVVECQHEWGYKVGGEDIVPAVFTCTKCGSVKPMNPNYTMGFVGGVTASEVPDRGDMGEEYMNECEHRFTSKIGTSPKHEFIHCLKCGERKQEEKPTLNDPENSKKCMEMTREFNEKPPGYAFADRLTGKPEPAKPKLVAREFWLYKDSANHAWHICETEPGSKWNYKIKVREILDTEEK